MSESGVLAVVLGSDEGLAARWRELNGRPGLSGLVEQMLCHYGALCYQAGVDLGAEFGAELAQDADLETALRLNAVVPLGQAGGGR
jgi:hypothetical protein